MKNLLIVFLISLSFIIINSYDLNSWYYSAIGDEYAFFNYAKEIVQGNSRPNIFSENGPYGVYPVLPSYFQAFTMGIFEPNVFGWKISSVFLILFTIPFLYLLAFKLTNKITALISTVFFASSHYLWAHIHSGYTHIAALLPLIASLSLYTSGMFFLSGIFAGLGLFTYYTSRITPLIIFTWIFINRKKAGIIKPLFSFLFGFILLLIPFIIVNKEVFIRNMLNRSFVSQNDPSSYGPSYKFIIDNITRNAVAFWYNTNQNFYISGSLLDPITGFFFALGLVVILIKQFIKSSLIMSQLISALLLSLLICAVFSPYGYTVISRLKIMLPFVLITAGIGLKTVIDKINSPFLKRVSLFVAISFVFVLNFYRFHIVSPKKIQPTIEALTIKKLLSSECKNNRENFVVGKLNHSPIPLLKPALEAYELNNVILLDSTQEVPGTDGCVVDFNRL